MSELMIENPILMEQSIDQSNDQLNNQSLNLNQKIEVLSEHMQMYHKKGLFMEADRLKEQIEELRIKQIQKSIHEINERFKQEMIEMEKEHLSQFYEFNDYWDQKANEYMQQAQQYEAELKSNQKTEIIGFTQQIDDCLPATNKETPEMLNLKKIQQELAKKQNYKEAHQIQQKYQELQRQQNEKYQCKREQKIKNLQKQLVQKHKNEMNAYESKVEMGKKQQQKIRNNELQKILKRQQGQKNELYGEYKNIQTKWEKELEKIKKNQKTGKEEEHCESRYSYISSSINMRSVRSNRSNRDNN